MKILIDTNWLNFIQDLSPDKQNEILLAILDYPNRECSLNCWVKVIEPQLEKGKIAYFNRIKNLKQNNHETNTDTATEPNPTCELVGDKDKDKDIDLNIETLFFDFWENYTPIKCNGKFVDKGSRKISFEKFSKIIKSGVKYENIISGLHAYLNHCRANNQLTCGVPVFLNQQRWLDDYNSTTVDSTNTTGERQEPRSMLEVYAEIANQYK